METTLDEQERITISDILELASWERPRSSDELSSFVSSRHEKLPSFADIDIL